MKKIVVIFLFFNLLFTGNTFSQTHLISTQEFKIRVDTSVNFQIIDIRKPSEFKRGHLKGAININYYDKDFKQQLAKLDKSKPTYIYCHIGGRSGNSMKTFKALNFKAVYDMKKGIVGWQKLKYPLIY